MACNVCDCNAGMSNTGVGCAAFFRDTFGLIGVPLYDSAGVRNGIELSTAVLNAAFFTARINDTDASQRWYPFPSNDGLKEVESTRPDSTYKEYTDGTSQFVKKGIKPFVGQITGRNANPKLVGKLDAIRCVTGGFGFYKIDRDGNLIGEISSDGNWLYPVAIDSESFDSNFMEASPTEPAYVGIRFNFAQSSLDKNMAMILCSEMSYDVKLLRGLIDVCAVFSNITENGYTVQLVTDWGSAINPVNAVNLTVSNFTLIHNSTDDLPVDISSITETPTGSGSYAVVFVMPQDPGDELTQTIVNPGYDFTCAAATFVIPTS